MKANDPSIIRGHTYCAKDYSVPEQVLCPNCEDVIMPVYLFADGEQDCWQVYPQPCWCESAFND